MTTHTAMDYVEFDVTIPLVRLNPDGSRDEHDVVLRLPAANQFEAQDVADEVAWVIVSNLPNEGDNNRYGWKIARCGVAVEPTAPGSA